MRWNVDRRAWWRRGRIAVIVLVLLFAVVGIVGFFVAPGIIKSQAERQITEQLGRRATIGAVRLNPYLLAATIDDIRVYDTDGRAVTFAVDEVYADVSLASLFKRALVFDRLTIRHPVLRIVRLAPQRFDVSDIVDRIAARPKSDSTTFFSLNNIELDGGSIDIDDRVTGRRHRVDALRIALPFVSNLPYDATIFVTPEFAARIDGSAIGVSGRAQPFSTARETAMDVDVGDLDLTEYADLSPVKLPFRLTSGRLSAKLALSFKAPSKDAAGKALPQSLGLAGHVGVAALDIAHVDGRRAIAAKSIDVDIARIDPVNGVVALQSVAIDEPAIDVTRRADGSVDLVDLFRMPTSDATPPQNDAKSAPDDAKSAPPQLTVAHAQIARGRVHVVDETPAKATTLDLKDVAIEADAIALHGPTPTRFKASVATDDGATLTADGTAVFEQRTFAGSIAVKAFRPARVAPYLASMLAARIDDGTVDVAAQFRVDLSGPAPTGTVDRIAVRIARLKTTLPDEKTPSIAADVIALDGGRFDLERRAFSADALTLTAPSIAIRRDAKGRVNLRAAIVEARPVVNPPTPAPTGAAVRVVPVVARPFTATVKTLAIERGDVAFEDLAAATPVRVHAHAVNLTAANVGTAMDAVVPFSLDAVVDPRGKLAVRGKVALAPLDVDATIDANQVAVGWLAAYGGQRLNIVVDTADLTTKGTLKVARAQAADAPLRVAYKGSLGVSRMRALDRLTGDEFVRWQTLAVPTVDFAMPGPKVPIAITLGPVALSDFYARVIVNANGRLNLQDVVASPGQARSVTAAETAEPQPAPTPAPTPAGPKPLVRVAGIQLTNGRIGITDNLIRPNYSANLTDLAGTVAALASDDPKPAALKITGRIDGEGTLAVEGAIAPLAPTLFVDLSAQAKDIELTRLSAYAVKYAGYGITRGRLSTTVRYHIENGRLDATNRLFLDQLRFGEHDPASQANLPVRLAVALLANSRGEIDVELPVSGSLSDPQFSIGGVLWRAFANLVTRAVTSPFSLLGAAFGGGSGGELGYIQFRPGVSDLTPMGKAKLETLAKALADRPALKLDIIGRYDPATDPDGIKRDHLLDRLKDAKAKDQSKAGEPVGRDQVTIEPGAEYAKYLAQVYDDTKLPDKPRNAIGLAKTIPVEDMERLLLAATPLAADDPRWLAEARADVVRHSIEDTGKIAPGRVFLVAPKLTAAGINDAGVPNRVDFALR